MNIEDKFEAAISDTDIIIDLYKSNSFEILSILFEKIYIPEFIYNTELLKVAKRHNDIELEDLKRKIDSEQSPFEIVYDQHLDSLTKNLRNKLVNEKKDIAGPGEVHCACYAQVSGINFVVSNNHTEFKYLDDIAIMISFFHILTICVLHKKITFEEASIFYDKINGIKSRPSTHDFQKKFDASLEYFNQNGYSDILKLNALY